jgi:hypothetical protein
MRLWDEEGLTILTFVFGGLHVAHGCLLSSSFTRARRARLFTHSFGRAVVVFAMMMADAACRLLLSSRDGDEGGD